MTYEEWIHFGMEKGWISPPYCETHDGGWEYFRDGVADEFEKGGDPCVFVLQLLEAE